MLRIFILTVLIISKSNTPNFTSSKTTLLTKGTQKSWRISSITPDESCSSSSDDQWIFFANGSFEFNHGVITDDKTNECSDMVNIIGTWEFANNESKLKINALHEKGNTANAVTMTILDASILVLNDDQLKLLQTDPASGATATIEFSKK